MEQNSLIISPVKVKQEPDMLVYFKIENISKNEELDEDLPEFVHIKSESVDIKTQTLIKQDKFENDIKLNGSSSEQQNINKQKLKLSRRKSLVQCPVCHKELLNTSRRRHLKSHYYSSSGCCKLCFRECVEISDYCNHLLRHAESASLGKPNGRSKRRCSLCLKHFICSSSEITTICNDCSKEYKNFKNSQTSTTSNLFQVTIAPEEGGYVVQSVKETTLVPTEEKPYNSPENKYESIREKVKQTIDGLALLSAYDLKKKCFDNSSRTKLAQLIVRSEFGTGKDLNTATKITPKRFKELASAVVQEFPEEHTITWYTPSMTLADGKTTIPKGKLYDQYTILCKELREAGIRESRKKSRKGT